MESLGGTITVIVVIILSVGIMISFPLMITANKVDDVALQVVQTEIEELLNDAVAAKGITEERLEQFQSAINSTGYAFVPEIQVSIPDENVVKKLLQSIQAKYGEGDVFILYDTQCRQIIEDEGKLELPPNSKVYIKVINSEPSASQQLSDLFIPSGDDTYGQVASGSATVY